MTSRVMRDFDLLLPGTLPDALDLLATHQENSAVMAGGTDLLVALKFDYAIDYVVSLAFITGLDQITFDPKGGLTIGAKVTIADILKSDIVKNHYPALWQAAKVFATPQLRNTATVVGNLLRASPAGDCSLAIYAIGGNITLQSNAGTRTVDLDDFWLSYGVTARRADEMAIEVTLPTPVKGDKCAFSRMTRTHEDLSKIGAAVSLHLDDGICTAARVAMGCVGPTLIRLPLTEQALIGSKISDDLLANISQNVAQEISPIDDKRSTADYRRKVAGVLVKRVIKLALGNGKGKGNNQ